MSDSDFDEQPFALDDNNWVCECDPRDVADSGIFCAGCREYARDGRTVAELDAAHDARMSALQIVLRGVFAEVPSNG